MRNFVHLHVHSQYSVLDGAAPIPGLVNKAIEYNMPAVALTDHGGMFGIKHFYNTAREKGIKPILGVEAYVARRSKEDKDSKYLDKKGKVIDRSGHHLVLLAKNKVGYQNLLKMTTLAWVQGFYHKPRIDKKLLTQYHEGLIASSACLAGEVASYILKEDMAKAEEAALWYKNLFGDDFYLEIQRHPTTNPKANQTTYPLQKIVVEKMKELSQKLGIKLLATNDSHFLNKEDAEAHDTLLCISTNKYASDTARLRYSQEEYFKSPEEMYELFSDVTEALEHSVEIANKVEEYELDGMPIMPAFPIPEEFGTVDGYREKFSESTLKEEFCEGEERFEMLGGYDKVLRIKLEADYLKHLVYEGAKQRYGDKLTEEIITRIDFELDTIKAMGFPGYFLIVQDIISAAKKKDVWVGPGRGSAAGSVVAYAIGITEIDPIKHQLLFERFLNPDRISMPDIDIDFDKEGRDEVLRYVIDRFGRDNVAHIVTMGTMAPKMAIRDVARVLEVPLDVADRLAKLVPNTPGISFQDAYKESSDLARIRNGEGKEKSTLELAEKLEGSVRQTGVHACGVLIGKESLDNYLPLFEAKVDDGLLTTQYDGNYVEEIGLLKMDLLGLKTLNIMKECIALVHKKQGNEDFDISNIPFDDEKTYEVFSGGKTIGVFQFESSGMQRYLKELKPSRFEDLIAMNALYRPGPMDFIKNYIARKHGQERIVFPHPLMEEILADTYGITVYQEQVMLLARRLANFSRGESDSLRKAMGKKVGKIMTALEEKFHKGCLANPEFIEGCKKVNEKPKKLIIQIWKEWGEFAKYAFNKSHSVCYADIAYRTGYLKAHFPSEFMSACLSINKDNTDELAKLMEECQQMGIAILSPDINESGTVFTVNKDGAIRYGMSAIKGVGGNLVKSIVAEREKNGPYPDIFELVCRVPERQFNKRVVEVLAYAGAFDSLGLKRNYFDDTRKDAKGETFAQVAINHGLARRRAKEDISSSLFKDFAHSEAMQVPVPPYPDVDEWPELILLKREKEVLGRYLSSHPLDLYSHEIKFFCTKGVDIGVLEKDMAQFLNKEIAIVGMVGNGYKRISKKGNEYSVMEIVDHQGQMRLSFFSQDHVNFGDYCKSGLFLWIKGKVKERYNNPGEILFSPTEIVLLDQVMKKRVKNILLEIPLSKVSEELSLLLLNQIESKTETEGGETSPRVELKINILDNEEKQRVSFISRTVRCLPCSELFRFFDDRQFKYQINT